LKNKIYHEIDLARQAVNWRLLKTVSAVMFLIGAAAFLAGILGGDPRRAWSAYVTNYVYWTGLAFGTFLLSPVLVTTNATWGRPVKRIAESVALFLPVSFILLWPLLPARQTVFWWAHNPDSQKAAWLNTPFFFAREGIGLLAMTLVALFFVYHSVQSDMKWIKNGDGDAGKHAHAQATLSPIYIVLYAFILTLVSFDFIMSLNPEWVSTLFGAYFFIISFYSGLAVVIFISALAVRNMGMGKLIEKKQFHDLGKLLFAFCVVGADFFYVQFLVIWYGNLPDETRFVITRVVYDPWALLAWLVLLMVFIVPFLVLVFRKIKMKPGAMIFVSIWIFIGIWLEKFLLVTPSLLKRNTMPLGLMELFVTMGFLGIFAFCVFSFLERYPILAISDPKLQLSLEPEEEAVHVV
jgi:Ni/Fe-hydrogenase subunit HybB-like protein